MKNFYFAYTSQVNGRNYAGTMRKTDSDNLLALAGNVTALHICATRKAAEELANYWNECYRINGTSIYEGAANRSPADAKAESDF